MREEEYILVTNLAKINQINSILRDILPDIDGVIMSPEYGDMVRQIVKWRDAAYNSFEIDPEPVPIEIRLDSAITIPNEDNIKYSFQFRNGKGIPVLTGEVTQKELEEGVKIIIKDEPETEVYND